MTGDCLKISFDTGIDDFPLYAWGTVPVNVTFRGGRPYAIEVKVGESPLSNDPQVRMEILENQDITTAPVFGAPGQPQSGCKDILSLTGFLASDAYAAGGSSAFSSPTSNVVFELAYQFSTLPSTISYNPFSGSAVGSLGLRFRNVSVFRELDNESSMHCLNVVTGSHVDDFQLGVSEATGAFFPDFKPAADGSLRLAQIQMTYGSSWRSYIRACLRPLQPVDANLSVLGLADFSSIPESIWSTPCGADPPYLGGANPLYGAVPPMSPGTERVNFRPDLSIEGAVAELVLLPGGTVPIAGQPILQP